MKPILLRAPKSPFEVVEPAEVLARNLISDNAGNLVFIHASWKLLSTRGAVIEPAGMGGRPKSVDEFNERNSAYVLPLANAFRLDWAESLERMTSFVEQLRIPVVVLGVGAQGERGDTTFDPHLLKPIEPTVRRFVNAVLDRGPTIGVRGEITATYLEWLGYRDVEVIGCPSLFLDGDRLAVEKRVASLDPSGRRMAINISPYLHQVGAFVERHAHAYPKLTYFAQDHITLGLIVNGEAPETARIADPMPNHLSHPLLAPGRVRFHVEPWPWMADLRRYDFAFGTRIHGNITALLAGTPAYVIAHDTRTLELARYFEIPHRPLPEIGPDTDAAELYAGADYSRLVAGHAERFRRFIDYVERHRLRHVFADGEDPSAFDRRIELTRFPGPISTPSHLDLAVGRVREGLSELAALPRQSVRRLLSRTPPDGRDRSSPEG
jgi:hypothetical protein